MNKKLKLIILVAEDDKTMATVMAYNLQKENYLVHTVSDGAEVMPWLQNSKVDLMLLDWVLPSKSGAEILQELRKDPKCSDLPVIMVSSRSHDFDKVSGLDHGADDYISKPFSTLELMARVNALLRRTKLITIDRHLSFHDIEMNLDSHSVSRNGQILNLSPIAFSILQIMMERPEVVVSRQILIDKIWGHDIEVDPRTVDVHITRLRKTLIAASIDDLDVIKTVRLHGYRLQLPRKTRIQIIEESHD